MTFLMDIEPVARDICWGFALLFCRPLLGLLCRLDGALEVRILLGYLAHVGVALDGKLRRASSPRSISARNTLGSLESSPASILSKPMSMP